MAVLTCLQSITIPAGGSMTIPPGATLVAADSEDTVNVTSECDSIDEQIDDMEIFGCYTLTYAVDDDDNTSHPMDEDTATIVNVTIAGTTYLVNVNADLGTTALQAAIVAATPQTIFKVTGMTFVDEDKRHVYAIHFKTAPSIAAQIEMKLTGTGYESGVYIKPVEIECS